MSQDLLMGQIEKSEQAATFGKPTHGGKKKMAAQKPDPVNEAVAFGKPMHGTKKKTTKQDYKKEEIASELDQVAAI